MTRTRVLFVGCVTILAAAACVVTVEDGGKTPPDATAAAVATSTATAEPQPTSPATAIPTATASAPMGKMCTRMGCIGGLKVEVVGGDKLAKGKYAIDVEADGKKGKCTFAAPDFCGDKAPKCEGDVEVGVLALGCDPDAKGAQVTKLNGIKLSSSPAAANITITRDGKKVGEARLAPQYKEVRPNGPECDPVCKTGAEKIDVK